MAARIDPQHISARHQPLHHFVAKSEWSDTAVMAGVPMGVVLADTGYGDETAFREGITAITIERSTRTYPGTLSALQLDKAEVNFVAQ